MKGEQEAEEGMIVMKERFLTFLESKANHNDFAKDLPSSIIYIVEGGSRLYRTNGPDSDYDMRGVSIMNEDYILGLKAFEHTKLNGGKEGITTAGDMDAEVFHYDSYIQRIRNGEVIPVEMLHAPKENIIFMDEGYKMIHDNRHLFFSKNLIRHYKGLIFRHLQQMEANIKKVKKPEKIHRIETYGYETKDFMKAVLFSRICNEFLVSGELNYARHDAKELLELKNGACKTVEEAKQYVQSLLKERDALMETSTIPNQPAFEPLNVFMKELNHYVLKRIGVAIS